MNFEPQSSSPSHVCINFLLTNSSLLTSRQFYLRSLQLMSCFQEFFKNSNLGHIIALANSLHSSQSHFKTDFVQFSSQLQDGCGIRGSEGTRIVGGSPIKQHEYPWLCSLKLKGGHICGITLISVYPQQTILVGAAHCYNQGKSVKSVSDLKKF